MNKNRIEGVAEQGERARNREALVVKARRRRSGGCAVKECVLTWGDLASWLKGRRGDTERGVSSGHSSCLYGAKGQRNRRRRPWILGDGLSQMFALAKLADMVNRVKPEALRQRETKSSGSETRNFRGAQGFTPAIRPQLFQPPGASPHAGWCGRGRSGNLAAPIPIGRGSALVPRVRLLHFHSGLCAAIG